MQTCPPIREEFNNFKFVQREFFDTIILAIPDFLEEIPTEEKQTKLPPTMVDNAYFFSNKSRDMLFQIQVTADDIQIDAETLLNQIGAQISGSTAGFQLFGNGTKVINDIIVACMNYKQNSPYGSKYVILFLFLIEGKCFTGSFTVPFDYRAECTNVFLLLIDSLKFNSNS
ncbi:hypothetical protein D7V91_11955 [bacterium 1xD42-67]|nr:hypothetical protein D7V91_11955 [bacterium 1xD42-67]